MEAARMGAWQLKKSDELMTDLKLLSKATKAELDPRDDGQSTRPAARPSGVASLRFAVAHTPANV